MPHYSYIYSQASVMIYEGRDAAVSDCAVQYALLTISTEYWLGNNYLLEEQVGKN